MFQKLSERIVEKMLPNIKLPPIKKTGKALKIIPNLNYICYSILIYFICLQDTTAQ